MCCTFHIKDVLPCILTISNRYPIWEKSPPWAASSSLNHKVRLPLNLLTLSAHFCISFSNRIKKTHCRCFTTGGWGGKAKHVYSRTNESEWGDDLRGAIFLISSMHLYDMSGEARMAVIETRVEANTDYGDSKS